MRYLEIGDSRVSVVGLGTWQFGSREWNYGTDYANDTAKQILERAIELGVNFIDTAEMYGFGASERIIGTALMRSPDEAFLATKLFPLRYSTSYVRSRCEKSMARLRCESIDLYQVHFPNPLEKLGTLGASLADLTSSGMASSVGVSNFSVADWEELETLSGLKIVSNQVHYSLLTRTPEQEHLPYALARSKVIIAYSPLEQGALSGKYHRDNRPGGIRKLNRHFSTDSLERMQPLVLVLDRIAHSHQASPAQIALAWVISHPNVVVIPGASSVAQLEANVAAAELQLSEDEIAELDYASDLYLRSGGVRLLRSVRTRLGI